MAGGAGFNPYKFDAQNKAVVNPQGTEQVLPKEQNGSPLLRQSFTKGVMSSYDPSAIPPEAIWDGLNIYPDVSGVIRSRKGTANVLPSLGNGPIQGILEAFGGILFIWNQNLYLLNDDGTYTKISATTLGTSASEYINMINWTRSGKEMVYLYTGAGIYQYDGTTFASVTPYVPASGEETNVLLLSGGTTQDPNSGPYTAACSFLRVNLSQRVAVAGGTNHPNTVYFSAPLDATYYPANQIMELPDDGGQIVGLANYYDNLMIFRDRDVWLFSGSDLTDTSAQLYQVATAPGCASGRTVINVPNLGILYLSTEGNVYQLEHQWGVEDFVVATPLADNVRNYLESACVDSGSSAHAVYFNREYRLCFPNTLQNQCVVRLNLMNNPAWYLDGGPRSSAYVTHKGNLYSASNQSGSIDKFTQDLTDNGNNIPVTIKFRRETVEPGPARIKRIFIYAMSKGRIATTQTEFYGSSFGGASFNKEVVDTVTTNIGTQQDLDVSVVVDGMSFDVTDFKVTVPKQSGLQAPDQEPVKLYEMRFRPSLKGHFVELRINSLTPGQDIAIFGYGIEYSPRGRIHGDRSGVYK